MSLAALEHQIETACLATEKLEQDAKSKGGMSRVGTSLRREFSAFKKVLENSKSRLQELEAMTQDLESMEAPAPASAPAPEPEPERDSAPEPAPKLKSRRASFSNRLSAPMLKSRTASFSHRLSAPLLKSRTVSFSKRLSAPMIKTTTTSFSKRFRSVTKSPHWLPSLGTKKKFFQEDEDGVIQEDNEEETRDDAMEREIEAGIRNSIIESEIEAGKKKSMDDYRTETQPVSPGTVVEESGNKKDEISFIRRSFSTEADHDDRVMKLRLVMNEEDKEKQGSVVSRRSNGLLSLEVREHSFRTNLQKRALALSRDRSAKVAMGLVRKDTAPETSANSKPEDKETLADFASRLERSIQMLEANDLGTTEPKDEVVKQKGTPLVFQKHNLHSLKTTKEPMSLRFAKSLRLMRANSSGTDATKTQLEKAVEANVVPEAPASDASPATTPSGATTVEKDPKEGGTGVALVAMPMEASIVTPPPTEPTLVPSVREQSFHIDGWKQSSADMLAKEDIAAQELKAREAYIKAMQIHQELILSGKTEDSPEVIESRRFLQSCFAKIEYWENLKEDLQGYLMEALSSIDGDRVGVPALQVEQHGFKVSQDPSFIGAQELKAREGYINSMREHQELIIARVKPDSFAWQQSQKRQRQCLAKLKYWEARNEGAPMYHAESVEDKVKMSNDNDSASGCVQETKTSPLKKPKGILRGNKKARGTGTLSQEDNGEKRSLLGSFANTMYSWLPSCANSSCSRPQVVPASHSKSIDIEDEATTTSEHKPSSRNHQKSPRKASNGRRVHPNYFSGPSGAVSYAARTKTEKQSKETNSRPGSIQTIESEAKEILDEVSYESSFGEESLETRQTMASRIAWRRARYEDPLNLHNSASEEGDDDGSIVSQIMIANEGRAVNLFCM